MRKPGLPLHLRCHLARALARLPRPDLTRQQALAALVSIALPLAAIVAFGWPSWVLLVATFPFAIPLILLLVQPRVASTARWLALDHLRRLGLDVTYRRYATESQALSEWLSFRAPCLVDDRLLEVMTRDG